MLLLKIATPSAMTITCFPGAFLTDDLQAFPESVSSARGSAPVNLAGRYHVNISNTFCTQSIFTRVFADHTTPPPLRQRESLDHHDPHCPFPPCEPAVKTYEYIGVGEGGPA